ncbi:hypothetical protein PHMEG_00035219 [Phytophthora megakarya]|uniref:Uncharacterized protein n=1 Tax=Phytophthora megakarya TaxID=4795 RepID=A0A225UPM1_9STRA|nr:hypothetical protein PHMEG_00035219 [Phytophthora megakarya]
MRRAAWQSTLTILRCGQRREGLPSTVQEHVDVPYCIPHWRLTQPDRNLKDELLERPLLSIFRFVRSRVYYVASPDCDTKFIRYTSSVPILGARCLAMPAPPRLRSLTASISCWSRTPASCVAWRFGITRTAHAKSWLCHSTTSGPTISRSWIPLGLLPAQPGCWQPPDVSRL